MPLTLFLGGARSGKSRLAEARAESLSDQLIYIATAEAGDTEMALRIARHKEDRSKQWHTVECPLHLADAVTEHAKDGTFVLVDCLTLWLSNLMHHKFDVQHETEQLIQTLTAAPGNVILVSNEVGLGLVPSTPLGREFRDAQGRLNQTVAQVCGRVEFIAAGLSLVMKDTTSVCLTPQ